MKNKLLISILSFASLVLVTTLFNVEPAEAYYGNWKSQTQTCTAIRITSSISMEGITLGAEAYEGTERNCVDGGGLCFWGSRCS